MSLTPSTMLTLGTAAPDFSLPGTTGKKSLADFKDKKVLVVMFICNHCPYVKHIRKVLIQMVREFQTKDVAFVAINSNDAIEYPEDSLENMIIEAKKFSFPFPYLFDEMQEVAKAYNAACTPDFFVFNQEKKLVYRGQFDKSRPNNGLTLSGNDLRTAIDAVLKDRPVNPDQRPSSGCNIKWKQGNEPKYFKG